MKQNFLQFFLNSIKDFFEAVVNLFIFFPYFFSIGTLFSTLFAPWKNLITKKTGVGFSFEEWAGRLSFNLVSRVIGFFMRFSILFFYFMVQMFYVVSLPFLIIIYIFLTPFFYILYLYEKSPEEKKALAKKLFIEKHLLDMENLVAVEMWFEEYYQDYLYKTKWWKLPNLFQIPPLARDWSMGYTPNLDQFCEELTSPRYQTKITKIVNRQKEIEQIIGVLSKNLVANVVIVGEEGVGKHTVVDALAKRIYDGQITSILAYKRILKLNFEKVFATSTDQKQRENLLEQLLTEAVEAKNIILMIENLDKYVFPGQDRIDLSIPIEKFAKNNQIQIIATTTPFFYQKFIYNNEKINRLFNKIDVVEIKDSEAEKILRHTALLFERRNQLIIPYETVKNVIDKSEFYITYIPFPEKAVDLLDNTCMMVQSQKNRVVLPEAVDTVLSEKTHIPTRLTDQMKSKLNELDSLLSNRVVYQKEAIQKLTAAIRRSFVLIGKRKKPLATFLFLGPTGVGKTETAKALSEIFFGTEKSMIRFDMSLYQSKTDIPNLVGSMESGNPGLMTKAIRENPYGVLLLDEIEKADRDLINIFLTILDEGYFTDGTGKKVDCKNLIIVATSNAGSDYIFSKLSYSTDLPADLSLEARRAKWEASTKAGLTDSTIIDDLIKNHIFSPEFLNRFDGVVFYKPLNLESLKLIAKKIIGKTIDNIYKIHRIKINVTDETINNLVAKGYDPKYGARNLERVITQDLEDKIAKLILESKVNKGDAFEL